MRVLFMLILAAGAGAADRKWTCDGGVEFATFVRSYQFIDRIPAAERTEYRRTLVTRGITGHPEDAFYHRQYRTFVERLDEPGIPAMVEKYRKLMEEHPGDSLYLYLYGEALIDRNNEESIKLLNRAIAADPKNPWPHTALAEIYQYGRFADKAKAADAVARYWDLCPESLDSKALDQTNRARPETLKKIAAGLRARLDRETEINLMQAYTTLWEVELRSVPPSKQDELKKTIAGDLAKLRGLPDPNRQTWNQMLLNAYKSIGDEAGVRAEEDEMVRRWPNSQGTLQVIQRRFNAELPSPKLGASKEEREHYAAARYAFAEEMLKKWPDDAGLLSARFHSVIDLPDPSPDQLHTAVQSFLEHVWQKHDMSGFPPFEYRAAEGYIAHGVNLEAVPDLVTKGVDAVKKTMEEFEKGDFTTAQDKEDNRKNMVWWRVEGTRILIDLYTRLKQPEKAAAALAELRTHEPKEGWGGAFYRQAARVAELTGAKADAVVFYQSALDKWERRMGSRDDVTASIDRLWNSLGGSAETRKLMASMRPAATAASEDGGWKKPEAPLPSFELEDMGGKTWSVKSLEGKTLLVNVWATWCGPCVAEHPAFQALYDKLKGRSDVQVLSFNVNENPAEIAPYIKKNGYAFPVIPAQPLVENMLPNVSIPRNWLVDRKGALVWESIGYGAGDTTWEKRMLEMLEQVVSGK
jgi:thiol-disulfide isomerase/thioredoxin/tetratricopeptide (TPR) repeat protein